MDTCPIPTHLDTRPSVGRSSILRRWKRNWFVLWVDGSLVYYQDESGGDMDGRINVKFNCRDVKTGRDCRGG
ncbi:UNVERIFIED_CONTAM: hypothetical protein K2H54_071980 [Gekko kuhli]